MQVEWEIIISASGTKGDIYPLIGIASELKKRNFNVVFQANDYFKADIERYGISFTSFGSAEDYIAVNSDPRMWHPKGDMGEVSVKYTLLKELKTSYNYIVERKNKKIFVISINTLSGAITAACKNDIPYMLVAFAPASIFSRISPPAPISWRIPKWMSNHIFFQCEDIKNYVKNLFSTPPNYMEKLFELSKELNISLNEAFGSSDLNKANIAVGFFPEWFSSRKADWPDKLFLAGFPLFSVDENKNKDKIMQFIHNKGKPIVFTPGTGIQDKNEIFSIGKKICLMLNMPGIFVGGALSKENFNDSDLYLHVDYINFEQLLPECAAIVHHGGIGTVAQAIKAGIPQLIRPIKIDQPDNADLVKKLGLGSFLLPNKFNAKAVAALLKLMIEQAPENAALKKFSELTNNNNAIAQTCDLIESKIRSLG